MSALDSEPIDINVKATPKPMAAPNARSKGLSGKPCDSSGPLAQKTPINARTTPIEVIVESLSPLSNAYVSGTTAPIELMGETTPIRPVESPAYKQKSPA